MLSLSRDALRDLFWPPAAVDARGQVRGWIALGLVVLALLATAFALDAGGVLVFTRLWPFALLGLTPWILRQFQVRRRSGWRAAAALWGRVVLVAAVATALAEPRAVRYDDRLALIYAVDHSSSIQRQAGDAATEFVLQSVYGKPDRDEAGLVFFGRDAAVELPPRMTLPYETVNVRVDRDGTNLAEALSLSAAMLPEGRQGRLVLISDGVATEGDLDGVLADLGARGVAVDVLPVHYDTEDEVWLERLDLPRSIKVGEPIEPAVILTALQPGRGTLVLDVNGERAAEIEVEYEAGKNRFGLRTALPSAGYYDLVARVIPEEGGDRWDRNNVALASHYLRGEGRVAIIAEVGDGGEYSRDLARALRLGDKIVDVIDPGELPAEPLALLPFDAIVLADVPREAFDDRQLEALHTAVFEQGTGFLMFGGEDSFGPGGWAGSPIEDLLPLSTEIKDRKVLPKGALAIILHTCEFAQGNEWAKRITKQAIKVLSAQDEVGILAYDFQGGDRWIAPMTLARNYPALARTVEAAQIGDMPGFSTTMTMAFNGLAASNASAKSLLVISDGDPTPPPTQLIAQYVAARITVTMVAINPHQPGDTQGMQMIARTTGGRFYFPKDPKKLPEIFIKEAKQLRRSAVVNTTFTPEVVFPSPILRGVESSPPLHGYVMTSEKPGATLILAAPDEEAGQLPLLARWRYGVGVAAAFTSDLGIHWGRDWVGWSRYAAFCNQLVEDIARAREKGRLQVRSFALRGQGVLQAEDFGEGPAVGDVVAMLETPSGTRELRLEQVAPRRYEVRFPLEGVGRYRAMVAASGAPPTQREHTGFAVPFSQEFLRFRSDPITLERIAATTGGRVLSGGEDGAELYGVEREQTTSSRSLVDVLLWLLAILIPADVALRRVQLDWQVVREWLGAGAADAPRGIDALKRRKEQVGAELRGRASGSSAPRPPKERSLPMGERPDRDETGPKAPPPRPGKASSADAGNDGSTMGRLLAAKRRAQRDGSNDDSSG